MGYGGIGGLWVYNLCQGLMLASCFRLIRPYVDFDSQEGVLYVMINGNMAQCASGVKGS